MRSPKPLLLFGMALIAAWVAWWLAPPWHTVASTPATVKVSLRSAVPSTLPAYLGASSCSAAPCHGGRFDPDRPAWNWAHTVWRAEDPHARAFADLLSPRGQEIADRFFAGEPTARASQDQRCLVCHLTPHTPSVAAAQEGVGCESCHGPSQAWRNEHHQAAWRQKRVAVGFRDLRDPTVRTQSCVPCHVGAADRQVNHDLIAAGHPALRFEMGAYHEQLPKHWDTVLDHTLHPQLEAQLWLEGQLESSRAALEVLIARLNATPPGVWPEFAEYDCESCHHPIGRPQHAESVGISSKAGQPVWGTWYFAPPLVDAIPTLLGTEPPGPMTLQASVEAVRSRLNRLPAAEEDLLELAHQLQDRWRTLARSIRMEQSTSAPLPWTALHSRLSTGQASASHDTWSTAAQRWLALAALEPPLSHAATSDPRPSLGWERLRRVRSQLAHPAKFDPILFHRVLTETAP